MLGDIIINIGILAFSSLIFWVVISGIIDSIKYSPKKQDRIQAAAEERLSEFREKLQLKYEQKEAQLQQKYEKMEAQLQKEFDEKEAKRQKEFKAEKQGLYAVVEEELAITESERKRLQAKMNALPKDNMPNEFYLPSRFIRDDKSLWNVNPLFFTPEDRQKYIEALDEPITRRAFTEPLFFEGLSVIKDSAPYDTSAVVFSLKENGDLHRYITELTWCDCPYHQNQHKICKHMMALALKVGAVTVDATEVLSRK